MNNFISKIISGINAVKRKSGTYRKIYSIKDLTFKPGDMIHTLDFVDLSELDLRDCENIFCGNLQNPYMLPKEDNKTVLCWTENVIWPTPDKMPVGFNPQKILEQSKLANDVYQLHADGINGQNIGIAIIDSTLAPHPEYDEAIKRGCYEIIGENWFGAKNGDFHASMVTGCAAGKTTGSAPGANIYFIAANSWIDEKEKITRGQGVHHINAIQRVIEINKTLPENKKIRFLSCSWGISTHSPEYHDALKQAINLCEQNGIMVLMCHYGHSIEHIPCDRRYTTNNESDENKIGIPTNGKTTPHFKGGYVYRRTGGKSSTEPYIAGIFACACQGNNIFFTRQNWQNDLWEIFNKTATILPNGKKIVNPVGIREQVTQISREMEINLIKQNSQQYE